MAQASYTFFNSRHDTVVKIISVFSNGDSDDMVNVELWNVLLMVVKEAVSSTYKYKQMYWALMDNICLLLPKLNRIDSTRQLKDYVSNGEKLLDNSNYFPLGFAFKIF